MNNVIGVRKPGNSINVFFADGDRDSLFNVLTEAFDEGRMGDITGCSACVSTTGLIPRTR